MDNNVINLEQYKIRKAKIELTKIYLEEQKKKSKKKSKKKYK